jgi:hypothetical protein
MARKADKEARPTRRAMIPPWADYCGQTPVEEHNNVAPIGGRG